MRPTTGADALAQQLAEAAAEATRISRMVAGSWWDDHGRDLADGLARIGLELDQHARRAARAADDVVSLLAGTDGIPPPTPRLPSVGGRRESEHRGVRLPLLDDGSTDRPPA
ncbi:hypothetical protein [Pseudonocardia xishanensis]|uniref:Excreted virulence factor EspC (Type VII ESX diderm) n=1 Tax=Pseudonocardia xishanensis TaxID=630995 RepID=A0ABP8RV71_9PSEU